MLLVAGLAVAAGVLAGNGLAGLAHAPPNDACSAYVGPPESSDSNTTLDLWPLGLRCSYLVGSDEVRSEVFGATLAELWAWITAAALLAAIALIRRRSAFARGAAVAAALLALSGLAWQFAGIVAFFWVAIVPGAPLVLALNWLLRPKGTRSWKASLRVAVLLTPLTLFAFLVFYFVQPAALGIAVAVFVGGAIAAGVDSRERRLLSRLIRAPAPPPRLPPARRPR